MYKAVFLYYKICYNDERFMKGRYKMKKIRVFLIMILCLTLISCSSGVTTSLSKEEHVTEAMFNTVASGAIDMTADVNLGVGFESLIESLSQGEFSSAEATLLSNLGIKLDYKMKSDIEKGAFDYQIGYLIDYKDKPLFDSNFFMNLERMGFSIDNFYEGVFVFDYDKIVELILQQGDMEILSELDYSKYLNIIIEKAKEYDEQSNEDVYTSIINDHLVETLGEGVQEELTITVNGEEITEETLAYEYKFDFNKLMKLYKDIFEVVKDDETVKVFYKDLINALLDEAVESGDYELLDIDALEIEMLRVMLDEEFDTYWNEFFESFLAEFESLNYDDAAYQEIQDIYDYMHVKLYINEDTVLRSISVTMDHPEVTFDINYVINAIGDDVVISYDEDKFIHVFDFIDFENAQIIQVEEAEKILKEAAYSAIDELQNGEGFAALFSDIGQFENEFGLGVMAMNVSLNQAKAALEDINIVEAINENLNMMNSYNDYSEETYIEETYDEIETIAVLTIDDSDLNETAGMVAETYGIDYKEYVAVDDNYIDVFEQIYIDDVSVVFIEDERLKEAAKAITEKHEDFNVVALFAEGDDFFPYNMSALEVYDEEPAFAAGYIAALTTETGKIGFVFGLEDDKTKNIEYGFRNGALYADENVEVVTYYANSDEDLTIVNDIAKLAQEDSVDILYHDAGMIGQALLDIASDYDYRVIDNSLNNIDNENLLTTHYINHYAIIEKIIYDYYGSFSAYYYISLGYNQVVFSRGQLSDEVYDMLMNLVDEVVYGSLYIEPYYED